MYWPVVKILKKRSLKRYNLGIFSSQTICFLAAVAAKASARPANYLLPAIHTDCMDRTNRYKIFTDPVHGFIHVPKGLVLQLLDHPFVQRLRRIRQLGAASLVFPGAEHSRFSHALGALGLMQRALNHLSDQGTTISQKEFESTLAAILLHDIGHGPFSHTLERGIIKNVHHEKLTRLLMEELNREFDGQLDTAIAIFSNQYPKPFLHQLISSQLDIDRLDYIRRDSMFAGVHEGSIGIDRIIRTMRVHQGNIVIDKKGMYAVENYIIARRLMYMQVYHHKTVLGADRLLLMIMQRMRYLQSKKSEVPFYSSSFDYLVGQQLPSTRTISRKMLRHFVNLDDNDMFIHLKQWQFHDDSILADLCRRFLNRRFFRTTFLDQPPSEQQMAVWKQATAQAMAEAGLPADETAASYYLAGDQCASEAYVYQTGGIYILQTDDVAVEFSRASDNQHMLALSRPVVRHYVVHLKEISVQ